MSNTLISISADASVEQLHAAFDAATTLLIFEQELTLLLYANAQTLAHTHAEQPNTLMSQIEPYLNELVSHFNEAVLFTTLPLTAREQNIQQIDVNRYNAILHSATTILNF